MPKRKYVSVRQMAAMNRRMWNDISDAYEKQHENYYGNWRFFRRGGSDLDPVVHQLMGPVRGKALLDLQCGGGEAALSWTNRGARVTGVDISNKRLAEARKKATLAGIPVMYVRGTVGHLPFRGKSFDRVYTGGGVIGWVPDVRRWVKEIVRVLKPGGKFLYCDIHPFLLCLVQRGSRTPMIGGHYFDQRPTIYKSMGRMSRRRNPLPQVERDWKLADLLNALVNAGLYLCRVEELRRNDYWVFRLSRRQERLLPQELVLLFEKPSGT